MCATQNIAIPTTVITALGSKCLIAPLRLVTQRENFHLRRGGYGVGDQSTTLALDRIERLKHRENRLGVNTADFTFVEITSRTTLHHGDRQICEDYLSQAVPHLMKNASLAAEIWRAVAIPDQTIRIQNLSATNLGLEEAQIDDLSQISLGQVSTAQMTRDLQALKNMTFNLIVTLPYLPIEKPEARSPQRDRLASDLGKILKKLDIASFDPSGLISLYGQNLALLDPARIKRGYTDGFVRMMAAYLSTQHLKSVCKQVSPIRHSASDETPISATGGA